MAGEAVTVFATCLVEIARPAVGAGTVRLLRHAGHPCKLARGATCCGQPAWNSGYVEEARRVARATLKALAKTDGPIVVPSGSCATMIHEYWPELFAGTPDEERARQVAGRVRELSDCLADDGTGDAAAPATRQVAYHDSCHMLRELGIKQQPRAVLADAGVGVTEIDGAERCCGFGGTFSVKLPDISTAMADEKLDAVLEAGADTLVGCDVSCLMHLEGRARRRGMDLQVKHLAEILDEEH